MMNLSPALHACFHGSQKHFDTKRKLRLPEKCPLVKNGLHLVQLKPIKKDMPHAQVQAITLQATPTFMAEEFKVLEDDESIIGGIDVSALVRKVPSEPNLWRAVRMIDIVMNRNIKISINTFSALIQRCSRDRDLVAGRKVHEQLLENNYKANVLLANMLIHMYGKCGCVEDAQKVFDEMSKHNIYSWSTLISAYAYKGMVLEAIEVFKGMQKIGNKPDKVVLVVLLQACGKAKNLKQGKWLHQQIRRVGLASDLMVANALIDMYAKCGNLDLAHEVFCRLPEYNAESWSALLAGYVRQGLEGTAFRLYEQMQAECIEPNEAVFVSILEASMKTMHIRQGEQIHSHIIGCDYESNPLVGSALVNMYVESGNLLCALVAFNKMEEHGIDAWNSLIIGHVHQALDEDALSLYIQLRAEGCELPDEATFISVIKACRNLECLEEGRAIHQDVVKCGYDCGMDIGNALVSLYSSCNCIDDAKRVFDFRSESGLELGPQ